MWWDRLVILVSVDFGLLRRFKLAEIGDFDRLVKIGVLAKSFKVPFLPILTNYQNADFGQNRPTQSAKTDQFDFGQNRRFLAIWPALADLLIGPSLADLSS